MQKEPKARLYEKYQHLAVIYAGKIFLNHNSVGYQRQDIEQELRLKLYMAIETYIRKFEEYQVTGRYKPMPLQFYLQTAMNNRVRDLIKQINNEQKKRGISIEHNNFDYGQEASYNTIDFKNKHFEINGVNLLDGLDNRESKAFTMYIKGHPVKTIKKLFKDCKNISKTIKIHKERLQENKELFENNQVRHYSFELESMN